MGSLLFNLCLASLPDEVPKEVPSSVLLLFADDKTLYAAHRSSAIAAEIVSTALSNICDFIEPKGLSMNFDKTVYMIMEPSSHHGCSSAVSVQCKGHTLQRVSKHRCLGIIIDDRLSWSLHTDSACNAEAI